MEAGSEERVSHISSPYLFGLLPVMSSHYLSALNNSLVWRWGSDLMSAEAVVKTVPKSV